MRELKSVIELSAVLASSNTIEKEDIHLGAVSNAEANSIDTGLSLREHNIKIDSEVHAKF